MKTILQKKQKTFLNIFLIVVLLSLVYIGDVFVARAQQNSVLFDFTVEVTGTTSNSVSLAWNTVTDADLYTIQKWKPGDPDWITIFNTTETTYTDSSLNCSNPSIDYGDYYKIIAYDTDTNTSLDTGWIPGAPLNDDLKKAIDLTTITIPDTKTLDTCNANRTPNDDDPEITECNMNRGLSTVWYSYTATSSSAISFDTKTTDYDTFIAVWTGTEDDYLAGSLTPIACNNDTGGTLQSSVGFKAISGIKYYIEIGQYDGVTDASSTSIYEGPLETERQQ